MDKYYTLMGYPNTFKQFVVVNCLRLYAAIQILFVAILDHVKLIRKTLI